MGINRKKRLVQYCITCGLTFILIMAVWFQIYRLDFIKNGITEMKTITDDVIRRREFYWLGQITILTAAIGAGIFAAVFYVTEEFFRAQAKEEGATKKSEQTLKECTDDTRIYSCHLLWRE